MRFPEQLYRSGDVVLQLATLTLDGSAGAVAASQTVTFTNGDSNYAWVVTNMCLSALPGGGEFINRQNIRLNSPTTDAVANAYTIKDNPTVGAANTRVQTDWQGELLVLPGWRIAGQVDKNLGVTANAIIFDVVGYRFPIGNVVRS